MHPRGRRGAVSAVEEDVMADMDYAVVLVSGFAVLMLALRGLQRL
jgi:hypothetical protein